jgi:hypothetical protein
MVVNIPPPTEGLDMEPNLSTDRILKERENPLFVNEFIEF